MKIPLEGLEKQRQEFFENFERETIQQILNTYKLHELDANQISALEMEAKKAVKAARDKVEKQLPTKYENPNFFLIMSSLADDLASIIPYFSDVIPEFPAYTFGTLPTGHFNARTIEYEQTGFLILFENEIFDFCHALAKIIALCMERESGDATGAARFRNTYMIQVLEGGTSVTYLFSLKPEKITKTVKENKRMVGLFAEMVLSYLLLGRLTKLYPYRPEMPYTLLVSSLTRSMEVFLLSHEYGHLVNKDLTEDPSGRLRKRKSQFGRISATEIEYLQDIEKDADAVGYSCAIGSFKKAGGDLALGYVGADIVFTAFHLMKRAAYFLKYGKEPTNYDLYPSSSHPNPIDRRDEMRFLITTQHEEGGRMVELGIEIENIFRSLWDELLPSLTEAHKKGFAVSPKWIS